MKRSERLGFFRGQGEGPKERLHIVGEGLIELMILAACRSHPTFAYVPYDQPILRISRRTNVVRY